VSLNWVTESWRLKLLAVGLSVLMLGAVAFAQNPPTFRTFTVSSINYVVPPSWPLIVINAPTRTTARVTGLADTLQSMTASSLTATIDLSKATAGPAVKVNLVVKSSISGVTVQNPTVPVYLNIDQRSSKQLTVQVRYPTVTEGWFVTKAETNCPIGASTITPCEVNFDGPASWETKLNAYADFTASVEGDSIVAPGVRVDLEQNGVPLDVTSFSKTVPASTLSLSVVTVHFTARTATTTKQVVLVMAVPSRGVPNGYQVTAITFDPLAVLISGKADVLSKIKNITLPAVDLNGRTSDVTFRITIPYPAGVTGPVPTARVTYSISKAPNVGPSPSPTPT
jgi:YbbR domain-containing protein